MHFCLLISMILASSQADPDPDMHLHVHLPTEEVGPGTAAGRIAASQSGGKDDGKNPTLGNDHSGHDWNAFFAGRWNCPCYAKCPPWGSKGSRACNRKCAKPCGRDYGKNPTLGIDYSSYVPVDASVPIRLNALQIKTGMNCPCFLKCPPRGSRGSRACVRKCAKACDRDYGNDPTLGIDYSSYVPVDPSVPIRRSGRWNCPCLAKCTMPGPRASLQTKRASWACAKKCNKACEREDYGKDYGNDPTLGNDHSVQIPVDASVPIGFNALQIKTGMNCPCLLKCNPMEGDRKRECEQKCANACQF